MTEMIHGNPILLFKSPFEKKDETGSPESLSDDEVKESDPDEEKYIFCRQCFQVITNEAERMEADGGHQHTFANPHGLIFEIGCFRSAPGCAYTGKPTSDFTWFKGFKWKLAVCGKCLVQMGWLFVSLDSESFNALILDRLVFPE